MRSTRTDWRACPVRLLVIVCALMGPFPAAAPASGAPCAQPEFEDAAIIAVYHSTDNDAQLIITGSGGAAGGITALSIDGPHGAVDIDAKFIDRRNLGQADFRFDTPEPLLAELKRAYPPGLYRFSATTIANCELHSTTKLSYKLLSAPVIVFPMEGATGVSSSGFTATWQEIAKADAVRLAIEDEGNGAALTVDLPGDATSFDVSGQFLKPGVLYTMDVIAIAATGNRTVADVQFTTGP